MPVILYNDYFVAVQGSYTCTCKQFYKGDGHETCVVDNACELGMHNCGDKDWCKSLGEGKFSCEVSPSSPKCHDT